MIRNQLSLIIDFITGNIIRSYGTKYLIFVCMNIRISPVEIPTQAKSKGLIGLFPAGFIRVRGIFAEYVIEMLALSEMHIVTRLSHEPPILGVLTFIPIKG